MAARFDCADRKNCKAVLTGHWSLSEDRHLLSTSEVEDRKRGLLFSGPFNAAARNPHLPAIRASLLHPCGRCILGDCAAIMENGGIRSDWSNRSSGQTQDRENGKKHFLHWSSPFLVGRDCPAS